MNKQILRKAAGFNDLRLCYVSFSGNHRHIRKESVSDYGISPSETARCFLLFWTGS